MKKKIVGLVTAALLLGGSIGFAASTSLLGAKVTGIFTIEQGGKKIADAAIINGSAYVPVRVMSEATGTGLTVEGKTITLESKETEKPAAISETNTTVAEPVVTPVSTQRVLSEAEKEALRERLVVGDSAIIKYREVIAQTKTELAAETDPSNKVALQNFITDLESRIISAEAIITDLKAQLGE